MYVGVYGIRLAEACWCVCVGEQHVQIVYVACVRLYECMRERSEREGVVRSVSCLLLTGVNLSPNHLNLDCKERKRCDSLNKAQAKWNEEICLKKQLNFCWLAVKLSN